MVNEIIRFRASLKVDLETLLSFVDLKTLLSVFKTKNKNKNASGNIFKSVF